MTQQAKINALHALFVGIIAGVVIAIYAALGPAGIGSVQTPFYWGCFIIIPTVFMAGGEWKMVPTHWLNLLVGIVLGGWLCFFLVGNTVASLGLPLAFGIFTCLTTFLVQGLTTVFTQGVMKPAFGFCPMAFVGMIAVFASCNDAFTMSTYLTITVSLLVGVVTATLMAQSGKLASKIITKE